MLMCCCDAITSITLEKFIIKIFCKTLYFLFRRNLVDIGKPAEVVARQNGTISDFCWKLVDTDSCRQIGPRNLENIFTMRATIEIVSHPCYTVDFLGINFSIFIKDRFLDMDKQHFANCKVSGTAFSSKRFYFQYFTLK